MIWIGQNGPLISIAPMEMNCSPNSKTKTGPKPRSAAEAFVIPLPPDSTCSDYMSTVIDSRYVRGAPRKNVPNEATLDQ